MEKGKRSNKKPKKRRHQEEVKEQASSLPDENTSEFGGIPFRNLKKNLGCG